MPSASPGPTGGGSTARQSSPPSRKSQAEAPVVLPMVVVDKSGLGSSHSSSRGVPPPPEVLNPVTTRKSAFFLKKMDKQLFNSQTQAQGNPSPPVLVKLPQSARGKGPAGAGGGRVREAWGANGPTQARGAETPQPGAAPYGSSEVPGVGNVGNVSGPSALIGLASKRQFPSERCSRCTMEAVWQACDVFWEFDPTHTGQIARVDYVSRVCEAPNVMRLRFLRRARLENRFRDSAQPVSLGEFLRLLWPNAKDDEFKLMRRWSELRECRTFIAQENFRGSDIELNQAWNLLDPEKNGRISAWEVVRAQILGGDEVRRVLKTGGDLKPRLVDKETFKGIIWPEVRQKYIQPETLIRMKREEDSMLTNPFAGGAFNMERVAAK
mmetsp:Transcript_2201/g.4686  ORF Transcript_2201/g.4686 Transcript_2201/m.4686 type:complete len:381 (+) Transcript_2201:76-1218(+)|eukprot:CAMPEP_0206533630 /NCGR_PEP_ID=MMETSP0325_2-20121206/5073_1 /ASSEMBLY_ACC=CAM_ASM_000347 /TAXON_ID=2866 /ORGANISM="Crypthecodinium cohnii, Strain Seligo" /LENGTH=380 /DNA_ID=CAMNT_0054030297 /DNA_START=63 /DNA_END=1205 /DNA_ORIENTATION=+